MSPHLAPINEDQKGEQSGSYKQADFMQAIARKNADQALNFNFSEDQPTGAQVGSRQFSMGTRNDLDLTNQVSLNTTDMQLKFW